MSHELVKYICLRCNMVVETLPRAHVSHYCLAVRRGVSFTEAKPK